MTTIVGGQIAGLSTRTSAEFSFLLAIPTLGAATLFDLAKNGRALLTPSYAPILGFGLVVSFVVAILVIGAFLSYLRRFGLTPFGAYRIVLGVLVIAIAQPRAEAASRGATESPRAHRIALVSAHDPDEESPP